MAVYSERSRGGPRFAERVFRHAMEDVSERFLASHEKTRSLTALRVALHKE